MILWLARNVVDWDSIRPVHAGCFVTFVLALIVGTFASISGVMNSLGWIIVAIDTAIALGFAYFLCLKKAP